MGSSIKEKQVEQTIEKLDGINFELVYRENLGDESLLVIQPYIETIFEQIEVINSLFSQISDLTLTKIYNSLQDLVKQLTIIQNLQNSAFVTHKQSYHNYFTKHANISQEWINEIKILDTIKKFENLNLTSVDKKLRTELSTVRKERARIEKINKEVDKKINEFQTRYNENTTKNEIRLQSDHYDKEAIKHKIKSHIWMLAIILYIPLLVIFVHNAIVFGNFMTLDFDISKIQNIESSCTDCTSAFLNYQFIRSIGLRVLLFSILLFILSFLRKNYNAEKHNQTLNNHRANSLNSSLMLLEKANTEQGKDEVLKMACNAIFSQHSTGFVKTETEGNIKLLDSIKTTIST